MMPLWTWAKSWPPPNCSSGSALANARQQPPMTAHYILARREMPRLAVLDVDKTGHAHWPVKQVEQDIRERNFEQNIVS